MRGAGGRDGRRRRTKVTSGAQASAGVRRRARFATLVGAVVLGGTPAMVAAHGGGVSEASLTTCEGKARSDRCEYVNHHDDLYRGTCQVIAGDMQCVRNRPIVKGGRRAEQGAPPDPNS